VRNVGTDTVRMKYTARKRPIRLARMVRRTTKWAGGWNASLRNWHRASFGAIALRSAFLGIERMIGGTEQASIRLRCKSWTWKASRKRSACPLRRTRDLGNWHWLGNGRWLDGWRWLGGWRGLCLKSRSKFGCTHLGGRQLLSEFQAEIPDPLADDLPKLLSARRMWTPSVGILLAVFICQNGFKGPAMQTEAKGVGATRSSWNCERNASTVAWSRAKRKRERVERSGKRWRPKSAMKTSAKGKRRSYIAQLCNLVAHPVGFMMLCLLVTGAFIVGWIGQILLGMGSWCCAHICFNCPRHPSV